MKEKYSVDFVFSVDIMDKALSEMFSSLNEPVPFLSNAMNIRLTATANKMMTNEQQKEFIKAAEKAYANAEFDEIIIKQIHFVRTENIRYEVIEEEDDKIENGNS